MQTPTSRGTRTRLPSSPTGLLLLALVAPACRLSVENGSSSHESGAATAARGTGSVVDAQRLAQDVAWLADDAREGRRAGTAGEGAAADWLAARMAELGLVPAGDDGFFQAFDVPLEPEEGGRSWVMTIPETRAGTATDALPITGENSIVPLFCSAGGGADGRLAFRGYGMIHAERAWDDYPERCDGAIALIVRGTPEVSAGETEPSDAVANPHSPHAVSASDSTADVQLAARTAAFGNSGSIFNKIMTAKRMGAVAVILAQHPRDRGQPLLAFHNGHTAMASLPAVSVSVAVAERLLPGYVKRVEAIDARAARTGERDASSSSSAGRVALSADVRRGTGTARNVLGLLRGTPGARTIVVGAHFDHLGRGGSGSLAPGAFGEIHNGADDNASGTAVVLEMARVLSSGPPPVDDVLFALWSGEELGLIGSDHWAKEPTVPLERVACNLNFDMVGRADDGVLHVLGAGTSPAFGDWLEEAGGRAELELGVSLSGRGVGGSDHQTFLNREIPALHFFSGVHADYHKPSDDVERFEVEGARRTAVLGLDLVRRIGSAKELDFVAVAAETDQEEGRALQSGWSAWFGSVPSSDAYAGARGGVKIDGTSPGSPAERSGFLAGDVLLQLGDVEIDDIYDFMYALQVHKPGDVALVRYLRDGTEESTRVTLASRALE